MESNHHVADNRGLKPVLRWEVLSSTNQLSLMIILLIILIMLTLILIILIECYRSTILMDHDAINNADCATKVPPLH